MDTDIIRFEILPLIPQNFIGITQTFTIPAQKEISREPHFLKLIKLIPKYIKKYQNNAVVVLLTFADQHNSILTGIDNYYDGFYNELIITALLNNNISIFKYLLQKKCVVDALINASSIILSHAIIGNCPTAFKLLLNFKHLFSEENYLYKMYHTGKYKEKCFKMLFVNKKYNPNYWTDAFYSESVRNNLNNSVIEFFLKDRRISSKVKTSLRILLDFYLR